MVRACITLAIFVALRLAASFREIKKFTGAGKIIDRQEWDWTSHCIASNGGECWQGSTITIKPICAVYGGGWHGAQEGSCEDAGYTCAITTTENTTISDSNGFGLTTAGMSFHKKPAASDGVCRLETIWSQDKQKMETCCTAAILNGNDYSEDCACRCDAYSQQACYAAGQPAEWHSLSEVSKSEWKWTYHCIASDGGECWQGNSITIKTICALYGGNGHDTREGSCENAGYTCAIDATENKTISEHGGFGFMTAGMGFYKKQASDGVCRMETIWSNSKGQVETCCTAAILGTHDYSEECACRCDAYSKHACYAAGQAGEWYSLAEKSESDISKVSNSQEWSWTSHCLASNAGECWQGSSITINPICGLHGGSGHEVHEGDCETAGYTCAISSSQNKTITERTGFGLMTTGIGFFKKPASDGVCRMEAIWSKDKQKTETCCTAAILNDHDYSEDCACRCDAYSKHACFAVGQPTEWHSLSEISQLRAVK